MGAGVVPARVGAGVTRPPGVGAGVVALLVGAGENCAVGVGAGVASGWKFGLDTSCLSSFKRKC